MNGVITEYEERQEFMPGDRSGMCRKRKNAAGCIGIAMTWPGTLALCGASASEVIKISEESLLKY